MLLFFVVFIIWLQISVLLVFRLLFGAFRKDALSGSFHFLFLFLIIDVLQFLLVFVKKELVVDL